MSSGIKRGSSSSSHTSLEYLQPNLKKQRIEMLRFSSTFTSSSSVLISGKQIRVPPLTVNSNLETPQLTKTSEIDGFIENKHCRVRRSCCIDHDDDDDDDDKSVSSPAQTDTITEQQRSNLGSGSGSDCEKRDVYVSDTKAARVELLKKRFSRIIVKAAILQEDKSVDQKLDDSVKMQMKKEILMEKRLKQAQIAAEVESKRKIQKKREAARKALLELERTVEVNDNIKTMTDFAMLLGYPRNCASCVSDEIGWYGLCFSNTSRTSDWRKR